MTQYEWSAANVTVVMQKVAEGWHLVRGNSDPQVQQWASDNTIGGVTVWRKLYAFEFDADAALFKMATDAEDAPLVARIADPEHLIWIRANCTDYEWHDVVVDLDGRQHCSKVVFSRAEDLARYHLRWSQ